MVEVMPVAQARAGLSRLLREFRADPEGAPSVVIGSHRKPEAVLVPHAAYERLARSVGVNLTALRELAPIIEKLARASKVSDVRVYGSVARGDQTDDSDVDLLVTPDEDATLFDIAQFELDLEILLRVPVSVTPVSALDSERDMSVVRSSVAL